MLPMQLTVGKIRFICSLLLFSLVLQSASCVDESLDCDGILHEHPRYVNVEGLQDSMKIGDTVLVSIQMPWTVSSSINGIEYDLRDLDDPGDHPIILFSTHAPLGSSDSERDRAFEVNEMIPLQGEWQKWRGEAVTSGDSTSTHWEAALKLVFNKPGRYYVTFTNGRVNDGNSAEQGVVLGNGITTENCRERIATRQILQGYSYNQDMIDRAERFSDVKIRTNLSGVQDKEGAFYVLVFE